MKQQLPQTTYGNSPSIHRVPSKLWLKNTSVSGLCVSWTKPTAAAPPVLNTVYARCIRFMSRCRDSQCCYYCCCSSSPSVCLLLAWKHLISECTLRQNKLTQTLQQALRAFRISSWGVCHILNETSKVGSYLAGKRLMQQCSVIIFKLSVATVHKAEAGRVFLAGWSTPAPFKHTVGFFVHWPLVRLLIRLPCLSNELVAMKLLKSLTFQRAPQWTLIPWDGPSASRP